MNEGNAAASVAIEPPSSSSERAGPSLTSTAGAPAGAANTAAIRVDFAGIFQDHLVVYGWVLGLTHAVKGMRVVHGDTIEDVLAAVIRVPRPDVSRHFAAHAGSDSDLHGFLVILALPGVAQGPSSFRLSVTFNSGETADSVWEVQGGEPQAVSFFQQHQATFGSIVSRLDAHQAVPLRNMLAAVMPKLATLPVSAAASASFGFETDFCCILENRVLVVAGWFIDPHASVGAAQIQFGTETLDFLAGCEFTSRPDAGANMPSGFGSPAPHRYGFQFITRVRPTESQADDVAWTFSALGIQTRIRRRLSTHRFEARGELLAAFGKLDADSAISLIEGIVSVLDDSSDERPIRDWLLAEHARAVERLPVSVEMSNPRFLLHVDMAMPIADAGIFLSGWFHTDVESPERVVCHNGLRQVRIDDAWVRHARADVAAHLERNSIFAAHNDQGFLCFVPLAHARAPFFMSVTPKAGSVSRLRLPAPTVAAGPLPTVRAVLTSFTVQHRALRALLDVHVGPAVQTVWQRREPPREAFSITQFGDQPADPEVSIIVPLFGRFDLAECQMALFADDLQLRRMELIYFVDDPAIYDAFRSQCPDLYATYQVPFVVAFSGVNLGFAGANNRASRVARGRHLLLLNSDVFPKKGGWVGEMLEVYRSLHNAGVLGIKLVFEDGSVQHTGMTFRRHPPWCDLHVNHHPHKGQSAHALTGVRDVDAVTAACMLVDASLYRELGGLSEDYIIGDFEDSDFCLRVAASGRRISVALDIEMYHLERQSQERIGEAQWRTNLTLYNCWLHNRRWAASVHKGV